MESSTDVAEECLMTRKDIHDMKIRRLGYITYQYIVHDPVFYTYEARMHKKYHVIVNAYGKFLTSDGSGYSIFY